MYLLDTNACIRILNDTSPALIAKLKKHSPSEIRMCSVVKAELFYGARHSSHPAENLRLLSEFFLPFRSHAFDDNCAECYGMVRNELRLAGKLIGPNDLMIASTAIANELVLVTHNTTEFSRVIGLRWEDWEAGDV